MKLTRSFQNEIDWNTLVTWTVHLVMDELPSNPGVNCKTTEKASMLDTASRLGGPGRTGSMPDWIVAVLAAPTPSFVQAATSKV